jgi:HAMP domain-containing protein
MKSNDPQSNFETQRRVALLVGVVIGLSLSASAVVSLLVTPDVVNWQVDLQITALFVVALLVLVGAVMVWRGWPRLGAYLIVGSPLLLFPITPILFVGLGFAVGLIAAVQTAVIATLVLPEKAAARFAALGLLAGAITIGLELFWPGQRLAIPEVILRSVPVISGLGLLALVYFFLRAFVNYTLRAKLMTVFLLLGLASVAAISYFSSRTLEGTLVRLASDTLDQFAAAQAEQTSALLVGEVNAALTLSRRAIIVDNATAANRLYPDNATLINTQIAQRDEQWTAAAYTDPLVQNILSNSVAEQLLIFTLNSRDHVSLLATDQYGAVIAASSRPAQYALAREDWWQASYNNGAGATIITQPVFDERTSGYYIVIALPIYAADGRAAIGVLASIYRLNGLADSLTARTPEQLIQSELYLDAERRLLPGSGQLRPVPLPTDDWLSIRDADAPLISFPYDEVASLVSVKPLTAADAPYITDLGWRVVAHQTMDETLLLLNEQQRSGFIVAIVVSGLAAALALVMTQVIVAPISRLTESANQVAAGKLDVITAVATQDEIGQLADSFNSMTAQLRQTLRGLEERSRVITVSAEVSRRLSTILDPQTLVSEVVNQVQTAFNYYHVHIYLLDEKKRALIMSGGTGEAGAAMLVGNHKLALDQGLVGRAFSQNKPVLAADVLRAPGWLSNPLLPDTRSEIAVPIVVGGRPLGVLDVQHNIVNGLSDEDGVILQAIADQVGIALQNARLYAAAERQASREALVNAIGQRIQSAATIEMALEIAAEELGKATGATAARAQIALSQRRQPAASGEMES